MKKLFSMLGLLSIGALALTGCSTAEDQAEIIAPNTQNDIKNFEQNKSTITNPDGTVSTVEEGSEGNAIVSTVGEEPMKGQVELVNTALKNSAQFMELNKSKEGYAKDNDYSYSVAIQVDVVRELSSAKSYCLLATSREDSGINLFYDSQTKKVVPEGQSCKDPIGNHWEPRQSMVLE